MRRALVENQLTGSIKAMACLGGVSRARIAQIMNLLNLRPEIERRLLFLSGAANRPRLRRACPVVLPCHLSRSFKLPVTSKTVIELGKRVLLRFNPEVFPLPGFVRKTKKIYDSTYGMGI